MFIYIHCLRSNNYMPYIVELYISLTLSKRMSTPYELLHELLVHGMSALDIVRQRIITKLSDDDRDTWRDAIIKTPGQRFYDGMMRRGLIKFMDYLKVVSYGR